MRATLAPYLNDIVSILILALMSIALIAGEAGAGHGLPQGVALALGEDFRLVHIINDEEGGGGFAGDALVLGIEGALVQLGEDALGGVHADSLWFVNRALPMAFVCEKTSAEILCPGNDHFGPNYARLQTIKSQFDAGNLFRMNSNIKPA